MKNIKYIVVFTLLMSVFSCSDKLNTTPTRYADGDQIFTSLDGAKAAMNGIYRILYDYSLSTASTHENGGVMSIVLATDLMGDDMVHIGGGSGWYLFDYYQDVRYKIYSENDRPCGWWRYFYKIVDASNRIIVSTPDIVTNDEEEKSNVLAQAYAMRAFAYFNLVNLYQQTYSNDPQAPGIPIYTEPTTKETVGKGRGTIAKVYTQINEDLDKSITLFKASPSISQEHKSNISIEVAYGFRARVALVQENFADAITYAKEALKKEGLSLMSSADLVGGFNLISNVEWMWGSEILEAQSLGLASFFSVMDPNAGGYASSEQKLMTNWLYDRMSTADVRRGWVVAPTVDFATVNSNADAVKYVADILEVNPKDVWYTDVLSFVDNNKSSNGDEVRRLLGVKKAPNADKLSYIQRKFRVRSKGSWASDYIYMRASEMYLIIAEANCRIAVPNYVEAKKYLSDLMSVRDASYNASVFPNENTITLVSNDESALANRNILDEILLQRRIELWGEGFRLFDLGRLKSDLSRLYYMDITGNNAIAVGTNHTAPFAFTYNEQLDGQAVNYYDSPGDGGYILQIPNVEFNNNPNIGFDEQNK